MNLTTAFLFLFITIVIPGFIFLRIYFFGEFSKQFTTKENIPRLLLMAVIPGLLISAAYLPVFNWITEDDVKIDQILILFEKLSKSTVHQDAKSLLVFGNYGCFINYCFWEYLATAGIAFLFSRIIVRGFKLDHTWKTLRYSNQWYYIFSGEVFEFNKFKHATKTLSKRERKGEEVILARVDVLIKGAEGSELYTGYVADYDLNPGDISKLDNIYLLDAIRYKKVELTNGETNIKNPEVIEKRLIPGELFVLNMANVVNINVSYLFHRPKKPEQNEETESAQVKLVETKRYVSKLFADIMAFVSILLMLCTAFIFYNPSWINYVLFESFHNHAFWFHKALLFVTCMGFLATINPNYNEKEKRHYYLLNEVLIEVIVYFVLLLLFFLFYNLFPKENIRFSGPDLSSFIHLLKTTI